MGEGDDVVGVGAADGAEVALKEKAQVGEFVDAIGEFAEDGHAFGVGEDDGVGFFEEPFDGTGGPCGPVGFPEVDEDIFAGVAVGGDAVLKEAVRLFPG